MNNNKFKVIFCLIQVFYCVATKRISELKCNEAASLNSNSQSLQYSYIMEIVLYSYNETRFCPVTLISKDFVLAIGNCAIGIISDARSTDAEVLVRKLELSGEQHLNSKLFSVKRINMSDLLDNRYEIALIQLNEKVSYHNSTTILRPTCIWTRSLDPSATYLMYSKRDTINRTNSFNIFTIDECPAGDTTTNSVCFVIYSDYPSGDGLIRIKVKNQTYIFSFMVSIQGTGRYSKIETIKISSFIEWIESIVWPNQPLECGDRKVKHKQLMTHALPSYHGEFPWHVAIYKNIRRYICGGTIINSHTILTAAHCVHDERGVLPPNRFLILAGTNRLNEYPLDARYYGCEAIKVHENYNWDYLENDIALLKLMYPITFSNYILPICLSEFLDSNNITMGLVAGWGRNEKNQQSEVLLQATLPIIDDFQCRARNRAFFPTYLNPHNYCAGYANGTNVCSGDSGGSMIFKHNSQWYIRGIVSVGVALENSDRCDVTELVLFTDVLKLYNWIIENLYDDQ